MIIDLKPGELLRIKYALEEHIKHGQTLTPHEQIEDEIYRKNELLFKINDALRKENNAQQSRDDRESLTKGMTI